MCCFFFFKQKTAYEMRISDWSSDVCSSDLLHRHHLETVGGNLQLGSLHQLDGFVLHDVSLCSLQTVEIHPVPMRRPSHQERKLDARNRPARNVLSIKDQELRPFLGEMGDRRRSEEHTSELKSLMRISSAVFCLKKKN